MMPQTVRVVKRMREILTPEGSWVQEVYATDDTNKKVSWQAKEAVCWCIEGAMYKAFQEINLAWWMNQESRPVWQEIIAYFDDMNIPDWNDTSTRTHAEVLAKLDSIIGDAT